jgi:hypothetical protein
MAPSITGSILMNAAVDLGITLIVTAELQCGFSQPAPEATEP